MPIKAIIFDLGQVLDAPKDPAEAKARRQILADKLGLNPADLRFIQVAKERGKYDIQEKHTDRIVYHALQSLYRSGKLIIYPVPDKNNLFLSDLRTGRFNR